MHDPQLSIVIPAYLEAENLKEILPAINKTLGTMGTAYEVIVVDTVAPMDDTPAQCKNNNARYLNRAGGNDYADAVRTAIKSIKGNHVIFMDADGSHSPEFIKDLYHSREGFDVVIASRYVQGGRSENTASEIIMSRLVNIGFSVFLHLPCHDVSNSFKLYRTSLLKEIHLTCKHFDVIEEILVKLRRKNRGLKIKEIPYFFKKRKHGTTKRNLFLFAASYIFTLIRLKLIK